MNVQVQQRPDVIARGMAWFGRLVEDHPIRMAAGLVALTLLAHAVVLATPGFFSHDEWDKFDHIHRHGFRDFALAYGGIKAGPYFGYPMRPIGFLQQGVASLWMQSAPALSHLVGVLNHASVALVFVWVLRRAGVTVAVAGLSGALFVLSPLTTMATGWVAASFDQLYVLFALLGAAVLVKLPAGRLTLPAAAGLILATGAALLSKEASVATPIAVLVLGYISWIDHPERFSWRPFALAFVAVLIPIVAYLVLRLPAITASLAGNSEPVYVPSISNAPGNVWRFASFPFRLKLVEMSAGVFRSPWQPLAAVAAHMVLVGIIGRLFGLRWVVAYVAGYFAFLLPVLPLPNPGAHTMYASALAMSLALAAALVHAVATGQRRIAAVVVVGAIALYGHSLAIQVRLYEHGVCQTRFLADVDALLAQQSPGAQGVVIVPEDDEYLQVAIRAVAGRPPYTREGKPIVTFDAPEQQPGNFAARAYLTATCQLRQ